jgi:hypothetical protein
LSGLITEKKKMGLADREYMRERARQRPEFQPPPEPSIAVILWTFLVLGAIAISIYAGWKSSRHERTPPAPKVAIVPAPHPITPPQTRSHPELTGNWDPARKVEPTPTPAASTHTAVIKCVANGVTLYAETEADCLAHAKRTVVRIDSSQNISAPVPTLPPQPVLTAPPVRIAAADPPAPTVDPLAQKKVLCQTVEEEIKWIDERARQPLSGQEQDWLAAKRKKARDEQFRLRC